MSSTSVDIEGNANGGATDTGNHSDAFTEYLNLHQNYENELDIKRNPIVEKGREKVWKRKKKKHPFLNMGCLGEIRWNPFNHKRNRLTAFLCGTKEEESIVWKTMKDNYFLILMIVMILLALPYPYLGTSDGPLQTKYTVSYGVNIIVFLISGITLKTKVFYEAFITFKLNIFIQCIVFGIIPLIFYSVYQILIYYDIVRLELAQGFCILGCLPMTINMCYILTGSANGDSTAALFNATFGNILGTFISPLLIYGFLDVANESNSVSYGDVLLKLTYKILIPLFIGQVISNIDNDIMQKNIKNFIPIGKKIQETLLALIVWAAFSNTFHAGLNFSIKQIFIVLGIVWFLQIVLYILIWNFFRFKIFNFTVKQQIAGFYCSSAKTMAMGLPMISAIFEDNPSIGFFTLPLLLYHPCLMLFGSMFLPYFRSLVEEEGDIDGDCDEDENENENDPERKSKKDFKRRQSAALDFSSLYNGDEDDDDDDDNDNDTNIMKIKGLVYSVSSDQQGEGKIYVDQSSMKATLSLKSTGNDDNDNDNDNDSFSYSGSDIVLPPVGGEGTSTVISGLNYNIRKSLKNKGKISLFDASRA
jgi:solute carrier family 10 (sodium/bile acid cotransporter), member 7